MIYVDEMASMRKEPRKLSARVRLFRERCAAEARKLHARKQSKRDEDRAYGMRVMDRRVDEEFFGIGKL